MIPSMPGYGFSGKPTATGWDSERIASAWAELMQRLGYTRFVAQGGDWGAVVTDLHGRPGAARAARHPHQHGRRNPSDIDAASASRSSPPAGLSEEETARA